MELILDKSILRKFLGIVALGVFNLLLYIFARNKYIIELVTAIEEPVKYRA